MKVGPQSSKALSSGWSISEMVAAKLSRLLISSSARTTRADLEEDKALHMGAEGRGTQSAPGFDWTRSVCCRCITQVEFFGGLKLVV